MQSLRFFFPFFFFFFAIYLFFYFKNIFLKKIIFLFILN